MNSQCNVQIAYFGDMRFICYDTRVLVQGSIVGTSLASSQSLIRDLEEWKNTAPVLVILGLQVYVNETCQVALDDFGSHTQCDVPTAFASFPTGATDANIGGYVGGGLIIGVAAVIMVIVILVVVIVVVLVRRSRKKR